jgi:hypothetical protein
LIDQPHRDRREGDFLEVKDGEDHLDELNAQQNARANGLSPLWGSLSGLIALDQLQGREQSQGQPGDQVAGQCGGRAGKDFG